MAVRKDIREELVVEGHRDDWLARAESALKAGGFKNILANKTLYQLTADYRSVTTWGNIIVTLLPEGEHTRIAAKATANVDNVFALFKSPGQTLLDRFKSNLSWT